LRSFLFSIAEKADEFTVTVKKKKQKMEKAIFLILIVFAAKSHSAPDQTYEAPILQSKNEEQQIVHDSNNNNNNYHKAVSKTISCNCLQQLIN
jgi:hypothetical protein